MPKRFICMLAIALLELTTPALADLKAIQKGKLPHEQAVEKAFAEVAGAESMAERWSATWGYETPKNNVVSRLNKSLNALQVSLKSHPDDEELLLLLGLVAHYSYNLDVQSSYQVAVDSLEKAQKLAPGDYRPAWFLGLHLCQANQTKQGMEKLLAIERSLAWEQLPSSFWDDYVECAIIANMPAHAIRAGSYANKLDPQSSPSRDFLLEGARKQFRTPDPSAAYPAKEVWSGENFGSKTVFTSLMFGLRFSSPGTWRLDLEDVRKSFGMARFETGPFDGKAGKVFPSILVIVRPPKPGETLQDFFKAVTPKQGVAIPAAVCPAHECLAAEAVKAGAYKTEGDGHALITVFKRETPEFPGVLFEEPTPPIVEKDGEAHSFTPNKRFGRISGALYYLVLLDTADSVLQKGRDEYEIFLKNMQVE